VTTAPTKREPAYTLRIWRDGVIIKELGPLTRREAARAWQSWYKRQDCGTELLQEKKHIPIGKVGKTLNLKSTAFRVLLGRGSS